jgi:phenylalanyl-tRNA synthetase beta chain
VLEIEELTGFKKPIRYTQVDVGEGEARERHRLRRRNFAVGDPSSSRCPGAVLPGGFEIAARKTYDHVSDGMICSVRELGIGEDHAGSWCWRRRRAPPARPAARSSVSTTSSSSCAVTPDRGYCLAMRGIAREMGTGLAAPWRDPGAVHARRRGPGDPAWQVSVADPTAATGSR